MSDYLSVIESESARFLAAITQAEASAPVPTCPDWRSDDLLWHLAEVHWYWANILASGAVSEDEAEAVEVRKPGRPEDREGLVAFYEEATADLLAQLRVRVDEEPAFFWLPGAGTVGSTRRMQAHEATIHRLDAELTAGMEPAAIPAWLADDGLDHAVEVMWAWWGTLPGFELRPIGVVELAPVDGTSHLVRVGRWHGVGRSGKERDEAGAVLADASEEASATVRGTAEQIDRWLWSRGPQPELSGDEQVLAALKDVIETGML